MITNNKETETPVSVLSPFPSPILNSSCSTSKYYKYMWFQHQMKCCTAKTICQTLLQLTDSAIYPITVYECPAAADNIQHNCAAAYKQIIHHSNRLHQKTPPAFHCVVSSASVFYTSASISIELLWQQQEDTLNYVLQRFSHCPPRSPGGDKFSLIILCFHFFDRTCFWCRIHIHIIDNN